jgi:hypothetical protein
MKMDDAGCVLSSAGTEADSLPLSAIAEQIPESNRNYRKVDKPKMMTVH